MKCGKLKKLWLWLRKNVFNKEMILYVLIAEAIFWSPCIVTGILAITIDAWWWTAFGGICAFWAGPFTPAVPLQMALAIAIKKIVERKKGMKINTNISLRDRNVVTAKGFKGLDTLSPTIEVDAMHSTDMANLISRDGVNHKRYGWETLCRLRKDSKDIPIRSVFNFTLNGDDFFIVYANKTFYSVIENEGKYDFLEIFRKAYNKTNDTVSDSYLIESWYDANKLLTDTECKCFVQNNKAYFVGCGDFFVFEDTSGQRDSYQFSRVIDNENTYIPTTTINITPEEKIFADRVTFEERNILNRKHKNTMYGYSTEELDFLTYYLDENNLDIYRKLEGMENGNPEYKNIHPIEIGIDSKYGLVEMKHHFEDESKYNQEGVTFYDATFKLEDKNIVVEDEAEIEMREHRVPFFSISDDSFSYAFMGVENINQNYEKTNMASDVFYAYKFRFSMEDLSRRLSGIYIRRNETIGYIAKKEAGEQDAKILFANENDYTKFTEGMVEGKTERVPLFNGKIEYNKEQMFKIKNTTWEIPNIDLVEFTDGSKLQVRVRITKREDVNYNIEGVNEFIAKTPKFIYGEVVYVENNSIMQNFGKIDLNISDINQVGVKEGDKVNLTLTAKLSYAKDDKGNNITVYRQGENSDNYLQIKLYKELITKAILWGSYEILDGKVVIFQTDKEYEGKNLTFKASVDMRNGMIQFSPVKDEDGKDYHDAYVPQDSSKNNITVTIIGTEYKEKFDNLNETLGASLTKSYDGVKFGLGGNDDRLFLVTNAGNTIYWSKDLDFTYFGDKSWLTCGTNEKKIIRIAKLNDSTLIVAKEYDAKENSLYIVQGELLTEKTEANTTDYKVKFAPKGFKMGKGIIGDIVNLNGDTLALTEDGVSSISIGENNTIDSRYIVPRAKQISNVLSKLDLKNAKCIVFNDKCYIATGKDVYVADGMQIYQYGGSNNYEWYKWENIPCKDWVIVDNKLHFTTEDGQVCRFNENFVDTEKRTLNQEGIFYETGEDLEILGIGVGNAFDVQVGDYITFHCDLWGGYETTNFEIMGSQVRLYIPNLDIENGETIYFGETLDSVNLIDSTLLIKDGDYVYIPISIEATESGKFAIVRNYNGKKLRVKDIIKIEATEETEARSYFILEDSDENVIKWEKVKTTENQTGLNPTQTSLSLTWERETPIVARWVSGMLDLGSNTHLKTITSIAIVGEKDLANRLKYGIETRFNKSNYEHLRANNDLDFNKLDLQTISLDSSFASTYVKRLNIRNVNYIMFYYMSDVAEDISINSMKIEFKTINKFIGVR